MGYYHGHQQFSGYPSNIVKLDVDFFLDNRVLSVGALTGMGLIRLICWARKHGTYDIPAAEALAKMDGTKRARAGRLAELVRHDLLTFDGEGYSLIQDEALFRQWPTRRDDLKTAEAQRRRARIWYHHRAALLARDGNRCVRCGETDDLTIDHIVPIVHGGTDDYTNLRVLCRPCNSSKGPRPE